MASARYDVIARRLNLALTKGPPLQLPVYRKKLANMVSHAVK
jgi:hypothetical protein